MINKPKYKNLLFDLGGVIMNLDRMQCVEAFNKLGMSIANNFLGEYVQSGPFLPLEEGKLTNAEFRDEVRKYLRPDVTDKQIDDAFCEFLVGIPLSRLRALDELRNDYKIYVLSNTNAIMWDSKIKDCFAIDGKQREDYFDGIITSYSVKCVKPDEKIFQYTIEKLGIKPEETLFFDDGQKNLDTAARLGFGTYLVKPGTEFMDYFND